MKTCDRSAMRLPTKRTTMELDALIAEATGYQAFRERDALQVKLRVYLEDEMRPWEKTFPDELWMEFERLTN